MTDAIQSSSFRATSQITTDEALLLEMELEGDIKTELKSANAELNNILAKLHMGSELTDDEVERLRDLAGNLTAADYDSLVTGGILSQDQADLLLAAGTIGNYDLVSVSGEAKDLGTGKMRTALENLYSMSESDFQFTIDTFKQQGEYSRILNIQGTGDSQELSYSLADASGSIIDMPTTPEIQRAVVFLYSSNSEAETDGAVKAFTSWDFATSDLELNALLSTTTDYEGMAQGSDLRLAMKAFIAEAAVVAESYIQAGGSQAVTVPSEDRIDDLQDTIDEAGKRSEDLEQFKNWIELERGDGIKGSDTLMIGGETYTFKEACKEFGIIPPNIDKNDGYASWELDFCMTQQIENEQALCDTKMEIAQLRMSGEISEDTFDKMMVTYYEEQNACRAQAIFLVRQEDHKAGGSDLDSDWSYKYYYEQAGFDGGTPFVDPETGEPNTWGMKQYLIDAEIVTGDKNSNTFAKFENQDGDWNFTRAEQRAIANNLERERGNIAEDRMFHKYGDKEDAPGFDTLKSDYLEKKYEAENLRMALSVIEADYSRRDGDNSGHMDGSNLDKAKMRRMPDGGVMSVADYLKTQGYELDSGRSDNYFKGDAGNDLIDEIEGDISALETDLDGLATQMGNLNLPDVYEPTVRQNAATESASSIILNDAEWDAVIANTPQVITVDEDGNEIESDWNAGNVQAFNPARDLFGENTLSHEDEVLMNEIMRVFDVDPAKLKETLQSGGSLADLDDADFEALFGMTRREMEVLDPDGDGNPGEIYAMIMNYNYTPPLQGANGEYHTTGSLQAEPVDALREYFGISEGDMVDIGMLMFMIMQERCSMLGESIQTIIAEQRKNTNDQADMNKALAILNSGEDPLNTQAKEITLTNGETMSLKAYFDREGITTTGSDSTLSGDELQTQAELVKNQNQGLANEGQQIMNELTQLSQKYQQAVSLMMNFLEKFDAMKQKVIDKIRAN